MEFMWLWFVIGFDDWATSPGLGGSGGTPGAAQWGTGPASAAVGWTRSGAAPPVPSQSGCASHTGGTLALGMHTPAPALSEPWKHRKGHPAGFFLPTPGEGGTLWWGVCPY